VTIDDQRVPGIVTRPVTHYGSYLTVEQIKILPLPSSPHWVTRIDYILAHFSSAPHSNWNGLHKPLNQYSDQPTCQRYHASAKGGVAPIIGRFGIHSGQQGDNHATFRAPQCHQPPAASLAHCIGAHIPAGTPPPAMEPRFDQQPADPVEKPVVTANTGQNSCASIIVSTAWAMLWPTPLYSRKTTTPR